MKAKNGKLHVFLHLCMCSTLSTWMWQTSLLLSLSWLSIAYRQTYLSLAHFFFSKSSQFCSLFRSHFLHFWSWLLLWFWGSPVGLHLHWAMATWTQRSPWLRLFWCWLAQRIRVSCRHYDVVHPSVVVAFAPQQDTSALPSPVSHGAALLWAWARDAGSVSPWARRQKMVDVGD